MLQPPAKKSKSSFDHVQFIRPATTARTIAARDVALSTRGHAVVRRTIPVRSRWADWVPGDNGDFGLDGPDEDWEDSTGHDHNQDVGSAPLEKGKRKRSKTAVRHKHIPAVS